MRGEEEIQKSQNVRAEMPFANQFSIVMITTAGKEFPS